MEDLRTIGQVGGGILAYAILVKVFDFVIKNGKQGRDRDRLEDLLEKIRDDLHSLEARLIELTERIRQLTK